MSGGSYDYAYGRIDDLADQIRQTTTERKAFVALLHRVAKACHDIEWVDSCDYGPGDETPAILACLQPGVVVAQAVEDLQTAIAEAQAVLARARGEEQDHGE